MNWFVKMLSVRVLGKCGGTTSDIADAMRWSVGLPVSGVPNNPNPAKVLNMSLGGFGPCPVTFQNAADAVTSAGGIIVAAAGNSNYNTRVFRPANCNNVLTVGATNSSGVRASFSNYGERVDISAPGVGVWSTYNAGLQSPGADSYAQLSGTSMAAPHVAGVVSLMAALRPSITLHEARRILQQTARPFASGHTCVRTRSCGAGIVDAHAALKVLSVPPRAFIPAFHRQLGTGPWTDLLFENFEGTFPVGGWSIYADQNPGYQWGRRSCGGFNSSFSAWAIGGGSTGSGLSCSATYNNNLDTWMIVGPYNLTNATAASLTFHYMLNTEPGYDFFFWGASSDFNRFVGQVVSGTTSGNWVQGTLNLTDFLGKSQVWIGFNFWTDFSVTYSMGVRVDNILLRRCVFGTCTATAVLQGTLPVNTSDAQVASPVPSEGTIRVFRGQPQTKPKP